MKKLISCEFNIDTARVELKYSNGSMIYIKMMRIAQKIRPLCGIVFPQTVQHGKHTAHFVVQKAFRVIAIQPLPQQETANTAIEPVLIVM